MGRTHWRLFPDSTRVRLHVFVLQCDTFTSFISNLSTDSFCILFYLIFLYLEIEGSSPREQLDDAGFFKHTFFSSVYCFVYCLFTPVGLQLIWKTAKEDHSCGQTTSSLFESFKQENGVLGHKVKFLTQILENTEQRSNVVTIHP